MNDIVLAMERLTPAAFKRKRKDVMRGLIGLALRVAVVYAAEDGLGLGAVHTVFSDALRDLLPQWSEAARQQLAWRWIKRHI